MLAGTRILVTGAHGFLGNALQRSLSQAGATDLLTPSRADVDLTDQAATREYVRSATPEIVIHLAAEVGGIGANRSNPGRYFYANMAMGLHLVEASRLAGVEKFVQIGTVCAYPKYTPVPFKEVDLWDGYPEETNAPYGIAKKALLVMLQSYREQYDFNGIYLLPANLYGPGDNFDLETGHVIPALIRKFIEARDEGAATVGLWGSGSPSREFLHVDDAARAITLATQHYDEPQPVNIGTGAEISIRDLAELIRRLTGFGGELRWDTSKPDGQPRRSLDISRATEEFGFEPSIGLESGLAETIDWWEGQRSAT